MRTLTSLVAIAALVGGVTIANAQQSGSPTQPSGPKAGGIMTGTQQIQTTGQGKQAKKKAAPSGSGSPTQPSGPGAGGAPPSR
jgi:hypothetical protein